MSRPDHDVTQSLGLRRGAAALAATLLTAGACCALAGPARAAGSRVPASQALVVLLGNHVAHTRPNATAPRLEFVSARRPLTRVRTVLPVLGTAISSRGRRWLHVQLPGRPSGHTGWIPDHKTRRTSTEWRISLKLSTRRVTVYHHGHARRRFDAVVGKRSTPTPRGRFFIEEALSLSAHDAGSPYALATSARSRVLQEFDGGPGQIALHGTNKLSGALGTAASHGCIRLSTRAITWLAERIAGGTPLTVTR